MFSKKTSANVKQIPPIKAALEQHVKRATYQIAFGNQLGMDEEKNGL